VKFNSEGPGIIDNNGLKIQVRKSNSDYNSDVHSESHIRLMDSSYLMGTPSTANTTTTTTEETKGRFQIAKSEERRPSTIIPNISSSSYSNNSHSNSSSNTNNAVNNGSNGKNTNRSSLTSKTDSEVFGTTGVTSAPNPKIQIKSNSDDFSEIRNTDSSLLLLSSNSESQANITTPRRYSSNFCTGTSTKGSDSESNKDKRTRRHSNNEKHSFINEKLSHLQTMFVSSYDNLLKKTSFVDRSKHLVASKQKEEMNVSYNSFKSVNESPNKNLSEQQLSNTNLESTSTDMIPKSELSNGDVSASNSKKKEIVKGRFTIIRDS